jgi:glycogen(starch) synthase
VIAPSAAMLRALEAHHGALRAPATVVPNGLAPAQRALTPKRELIFAAGRIWDAAKNVRALVSAAPAVAWPIQIAGDAAFEGEGGGDRKRVEASPSGRGAHHLGRLSPAEMSAAYDESAIFAHPARYEPFGLTVLEAAQRGCALVLGDIESLRENWQGAARFVDPDDVDALASKLRRLVADATARTRLARAARRRAMDFTARAMASATLDIYCGLAWARATREEGEPRCAS